MVELKNVFLSHVTGITQPKNKVTRPKVCDVSHSQTNTQTEDTIFPSTYHQGMVQYLKNGNIFKFTEYFIDLSSFTSELQLGSE